MDETPLGFKLLISYDVREDMLQEYRQFILGQYIPFLGSRGLQISQAWHTAYGDAPNRLLEFVCQERQTVTDLMNDQGWRTFNEQLEEFVIDFSYKVIPYRGGRFQL